MLHACQVEELISLVSTLDRDALVRQFSNYRATFPLDFTSEFLHNHPIEHLKHIFVALCLQCQRMPEASEDVAAPQAA